MTIIYLILSAAASASAGFWGSIPAGAWAVIGTVVGTLGLKLLEKWLNRNRDKAENRRDLNQEIKDLQTRLDAVEGEVTFWRNRFYEEQEDNATLRVLMVQNGMTPPTKRVESPPQGE